MDKEPQVINVGSILKNLLSFLLTIPTFWSIMQDISNLTKKILIKQRFWQLFKLVGWSAIQIDLILTLEYPPSPSEEPNRLSEHEIDQKMY